MDEPLIETWAIHNRINLYLLAAIPEEVFTLAGAPKHRSVFQLFAHIHNVRLMWLKAAARIFSKASPNSKAKRATRR